MTLPLLGLWMAFSAPFVQADASPKPSLHAPFEALLRAHVRSGLVDYDAFAKAKEFGAYLQSLHEARLDSMSRADRLAFWINVYNAYTIELVNKHDERGSIRNINKLLGVLSLNGPWNEPIVRAAGRVLTLNEVKNTIIRHEFKDPRVHMALVPANNSVAPLRYEAYEGSKLDEQLQDQTRIFLRQRPGVNDLDILTETLHLSKLFDDYRSDFGTNEKAVVAFVAPFFPGEAEQTALSSKKLKVRYVQPEWELNIQTHLLKSK